MFLEGNNVVKDKNFKFESIVKANGIFTIYMCGVEGEKYANTDVIIFDMNNSYMSCLIDFWKENPNKGLFELEISNQLPIAVYVNNKFNYEGRFIVNMGNKKITKKQMDIVFNFKYIVYCSPTEVSKFYDFNVRVISGNMYEYLTINKDEWKDLSYIVFAISSEGCKINYDLDLYHDDIILSENFICVKPVVVQKLIDMKPTNQVKWLERNAINFGFSVEHSSSYINITDDLDTDFYEYNYGKQPTYDSLIQKYLDGKYRGDEGLYLSLEKGKTTQKIDFNVIGYFNGTFGLATNSRSIYSALEYDFPTTIAVNTSVPWHNFSFKFDANYKVDSDNSINIFCLNYNEHIDYVTKKFFGNSVGKINTVVWASETEKCLTNVRVYEKYFSKIFAVSNYCAKSYVNTNVDIDKVLPLCIPSFTKIKTNEQLYDDNKFYVGFIFDFCSSLSRKNPLDSIKVFEEAFEDVDEAVFILKYINKDRSSEDYKKLRDAIDNSPQKHKIIEIDKHMPDINALYNTFNVYISLHRSEGSGLTMMDAIYNNIPVICTDYSGNKDFCNKYNSYLVDCEMVPIPNLDINYSHYGLLGYKWAQPNIKTAVSHMKYIYNNYSEVKNKLLKYNYFINTKYNNNTLCKQVYGGVINFMEPYGNYNVRILIHLGNTYNAVETYLENISKFNIINYTIVIGYNNKNNMELLRKTESYMKLKDKINEISYENFGADTAGLLNIISKDQDTSSYDAVIFLHSKTDFEWRQLLSRTITIEKNIISAVNYLRKFKTGIISSSNTIVPVFNNNHTIKLTCDIMGINSDFFNIYNDECVDFYTQVYDDETYNSNYLDIYKNNFTEYEGEEHWKNFGIKEKRLCDRSLTDLLLHNTSYPAFTAGNMFICNPLILEYYKKFSEPILELCKSELGKPDDTGTSTYTHALERIPGILCHHLKLDMCEMRKCGDIIIKKNYLE
jgi:hypothetical protein